MLKPERKDFRLAYFEEGKRFIESVFPDEASQQQDVDALCGRFFEVLTGNQYRVCGLCSESATSSSPPAPVPWSKSEATESKFVTLIVPPVQTTRLQDIISFSAVLQDLDENTKPVGVECKHEAPTIFEKTGYGLSHDSGIGTIILNTALQFDKYSQKRLKCEEGKVSITSLSVRFPKINDSNILGSIFALCLRSSKNGSSKSGHYVPLVLCPDGSSKLFGSGGFFRLFCKIDTDAILKQGFLPTKCETSLEADCSNSKGPKFSFRLLFTQHGVVQVDKNILEILAEPIPDPGSDAACEKSDSESMALFDSSIAPDSKDCRLRGHSGKRLCPKGCLNLVLKCLVCDELSKEGHFCPNLHFVCASCFKQHVTIEHCAKNNHEIRCVLFRTDLGGCEHKVSFQEAISLGVIYPDGKVGSPEVYSKFATVVSDTDSEIDADSPFDVLLQKLRSHCPRCGQIWTTPEDGDCAAVTCGRKDCGISFCGYCSGSEHNYKEEFSLAEAHIHVKGCLYNFKQGVYHPPITVESKTDFGLFEALGFQSKVLGLCEWLLTLEYDLAIDLIDKYRVTPSANRDKAHELLEPMLTLLGEIQIPGVFSSREEWISRLLRAREAFMQELLSQQAVVYATIQNARPAQARPAQNPAPGGVAPFRAVSRTAHYLRFNDTIFFSMVLTHLYVVSK